MDYKTKVLFNRKIMEFLGLGLDMELATLAAAQSLNLTEIIEEEKEKKRFEQEELKEAVENIFEIFHIEDVNQEGHIILNEFTDVSGGQVQIENSGSTTEFDACEVLVTNQDG